MTAGSVGSRVIDVKRDWVVSRVVTVEIALPLGQLEFRLVIALATCSVTQFTVERQIRV